MTRSFTCIICPNGCEITAEYEGDTVYAVQGATFRVMEVINTVRLQAPTAVGQVALADVCGLGADVIVTKNVARANA